MRFATACLILAAWAATGHAQATNGSILLFNIHVNEDGSPGETDFTSRAAPVTVINGQTGKIIIGIYARLSGASQTGISGAEFYIDGLEADLLPPGWTRTVVPAPLAHYVGDWTQPHSEAGETVRRGNIVWPVSGPDSPECQKDPFVYLGRIELQSPDGDPSFTTETQARVLAGDPPANALYPCPLVSLCDAPLFTLTCVQGGEICIGLPNVVVPHDPSPAQEATDVHPNSILSWDLTGTQCCYGLGTPWTKVYFGTTPEPPLAYWNYDGVQSSFDVPEDLALDTTYYWRVEWTHDHDCGFASSPVWSFTTAAVVQVEASTWQRVKQLFR